MIDTIVSGLVHGNVYALVAVGISLIFGVTGVVNFAQGSIVGFGAMLGWWFIGVCGWPWWLALLAVAASSALIGWIINLTTVRPLIKAPPIAASAMGSSAPSKNTEAGSKARSSSSWYSSASGKKTQLSGIRRRPASLSRGISFSCMGYSHLTNAGKYRQSTLYFNTLFCKLQQAVQSSQPIFSRWPKAMASLPYLPRMASMALSSCSCRWSRRGASPASRSSCW